MLPIQPVLQPIVDLAGHEVLGYEMLSRGPAEMESPAALFEYARQSGSTWKLERACRLAALRAIAALPDATRTGHMFFLNVNADAFEDPRFVAGFTLAALVEYGIRQSQVVIEITERVSIADYGRFEEAIKHYARQGFRIALDDFGSGHSGLVTLLSCRPHYLKLDMAITRGIHADGYKQMIVKSVVALAENIGAELIAEGVETWEELQSLMAYGVRYAQGYLLGKPSAEATRLPEDILRQLKARAREERQERHAS
ncbi:MAG: EAL domain-containing protein [Acidobacteria bacterium]|nr:EAL domain-containing protein [Acidobacteriota bacterium]